MTDVQGLKGFYDRYPEEYASWEKLIEVVDETAKEFGFRQLHAPSVERADLYRVKSGDELMDQMYSFEDKAGREISLIPEQTPTRARLVQARKDLKTPIKWYDSSKRWRYEDVQRGRDREFIQGDFDIFGIDSVEADAEIIAAAATIYKKLGIIDRVEFKINNRELLESLLRSQGVENTEEAMKVVDDKEKMSEDEFLEELVSNGVEKDNAEKVNEITQISGPIMDEIDHLKQKAPEGVSDEVNRMESLAEALDSYGVSKHCNLDLSIVRGLAYYTGLVFEAFDSKGELRALFGGGRYDSLVGLFGDRDVPAVGFAFGYSPTIELLKQEGMWPLDELDTDVYVLTVSDSVRDVGLDFASRLREEGLIVEIGLGSRGFGDQLGYADSINAKRVLIVGERDLDDGNITMKHMDSGKEELISKDEVIEHLKGEDFV